MGNERLSRRQCLGVLTGLIGGLAGCSDDLWESPANNSTETPRSPRQGNATNTTDTVYTRVYRAAIDSVVLLSVTDTEGQNGQGSGFVFQNDYLITNAHVVGNAREIQAQFSRGEWRPASVVGVDPSSDLAVLTLERPPGYVRALGLEQRQPSIGTEVVAIGTPFGLEGSLTAGLISGVNRLIPAPNGYTIPDAIQTSAPVNPGNSGGPLMDLDGRVVGVVSSGGGDNLAFAISTALVARVVPSLIKNGEYNHATMGVEVRTVTPATADQLGLDQPRGVVVETVRDPATGILQQRDVIVRLNETQIDSSQQFGSFLALNGSPGDTVRITLLRDGEQKTATLTLGTQPERQQA